MCQVVCSDNDGERVASRSVPTLSISEQIFPPGRGADRHCHDSPRLMAVLGGSLIEQADGASHVGGVGSVAVKPRGVCHANHFGVGGLHTLTIELNDDVVDGVPELRAGLRRYGWHHGGPLFERMSRAASELRSWESASPAVVQGLAVDLLDLLAGTPAEQDRSVPVWWSRVDDYLRANLRDFAGPRDVAREVGVHHAHLQRVFRNRHRCTMGEYVRRLRVEKAVGALVSTRDPLAKIALDCGFADQAHFTRVFKTWVGVPPGCYRRARTP